MYQSAIAQETAIAFHEIGGRQTFRSLLHLRVGEGQPDFTDFVRSKEAVDDFDIRTQESHVLQTFLQGFRRSGPHACPLDVHPDEILVRILACQSDGVFATSASQLQHDRMVVPEKVRLPSAFHLKRYIIYH